MASAMQMKGAAKAQGGRRLSMPPPCDPVNTQPIIRSESWSLRLALMEASLHRRGVSVLHQKGNFSCFISVPWEPAALQFNILNWQGTVEEEREDSTAETAFL